MKVVEAVLLVLVSILVRNGLSILAWSGLRILVLLREVDRVVLGRVVSMLWFWNVGSS